MHQNTPNYNSDTYFGQLSFIGGGLGGSKWFLGRAGGFFGSESVGFFPIVFYRSTEEVLGGGNIRF